MGGGAFIDECTNKGQNKVGKQAEITTKEVMKSTVNTKART